MGVTVTVGAAGPLDVACEALLLVVPEGAARQAAWFAPLDAALDGLLEAMLASGEFAGRAGQVAVLHTFGRLAADRIVLAGLGPAVSGEAWRRAAGSAVRDLRRRAVRHLAILVPEEAPAAATQALLEGTLSASYDFALYREPMPTIETVALVGASSIQPALMEGRRRGCAVGEAIAFARDLCWEPANLFGPADFAAVARTLGDDPRVSVSVLEQPELARLGMGALLGVGQGSHRPPLLVEARYAPPGARNAGRPLVLIGKTVTFDAGGLSLKPALDMDRQKADMGGGAAVLAAFRAAVALDLPVEIVALFPVVENMPGGGALRPGDVVRTLSGRTVEVLNTDAEGRLILADALHYAQRLKPEAIVDVATLTGASAIVFGPVGIGFFATDEALATALLRADAAAGERLWRLPLWPDYVPLLASRVADLANISSTLQQGSMMTAATFLKAFAGPGPWAHLDIYNTAWNAADHPFLPKGPTGSGTATLVQFLLDLAAAP